MGNAVKGEATFTSAAGRDLTFRFDFDALCTVEEAADKPISEVLQELSTGRPRLKTARALVYGGLLGHHPEITLTEAGQLLLSDAKSAVDTMKRALASAFPKSEEAKEGAENPPKPRRGTGTRS